jgi:hypothetical protein
LGDDGFPETSSPCFQFKNKEGFSVNMTSWFPNKSNRLHGLSCILCGIILGLLLLGPGMASAQNSKTLSDDPAQFIVEFENRIGGFGDKGVQQYLKAFRLNWETGKYTRAEQERFVSQTNIMLLQNYIISGEVLSYARAFELVKSDTARAKLNVDAFFSVVDSCILTLDRVQAGKFYGFIQQYLGTGAVVKTSGSTWSLTQQDPELKFTTKTNPETGKDVHFPYLIFKNTDLIYRNPKDSTRIYNTSGELNVMNKMFNAQGGRLDWSKMKLDPNDVYAELMDYGLNLNYSFVNIDTVVFYYKSLINKPLKGRYEDMNKGYTDINKANYPYFRSYDGGVVIENFIKNVRYEGGFSLRGVKKIGSAYFKLVDIPKEEPKEKPKSEMTEEVPDTYEEDFGYKYDESAYWFENSEEIDGGGEDNPEDIADPTESEDPTEGGVFDDFNPDFLDKELKLFKAQLTVFRNGEPAMNLRAMEFVLDLEKLVSKRTEVALYLSKEDSLTHPSVDVIYDVDSAEVSLIKDVKDKLAHQGFSSPYHNFYLYFDAIKWKTNTDVIQFTSIIDKENQTSAIESKDFFKLQRWNQFKGVLPFNPLGAIYRYAMTNPDQDIFPEAILAQEEYKAAADKIDAFKFALVDAEGSGFIQWNRQTGEITPLPKLMDWAKGARGRKDYDAIQIMSQVKSGNNAELDMKDMEIDMKGVPFFSLSDSQFVRVLPNHQNVTVKKNRDMQFDGTVAAGKLNFYGRVTPDSVDMSGIPGKFTFQYENYKVLVDSLDSLRFILVRNPPLGYVYSPLQRALRATTIEGVTGAIYINKPTNKNGLEEHPEYPVFDSYTKSFIYWYKPGIRDGVYTKDKLYFSIDPFVLDSLEDFNERALSFEGEFYSSEIFPKIRQKLAVMEDFTLGMRDITPPDTGYAAYDNKGRFIGEIRLDGGGLSSKGQMNFLHTVAKSDSFQMFFDSVKAVTNQFQMPGGLHNGQYFPELQANAVKYKWLTKKDEIELETMNNGEPIVMFGGEGLFEGKLRITKEGLRGSGKVKLGNVVVESEDIVFGEKDFVANNGVFTVYDQNKTDKRLFIAKDSKVSYDVNTHHSTFITEKVGETTVAFPEQKYRSSLGKGEYDRKTNDVRLESPSIKPNQNYFYSYDPLQDSLAFMAGGAHYNFDQQRIEIDKVPYIYIADAKITPDSQYVEIKPNGFMQKLENAVVEANQSTNYHRMYEAEVEITHAKRYTGKSKYDYPSVMGKKQFINMVEVKVQGDTMTVARGEIKEDEGFYLTDRIFFKGATRLEAPNKYMRFTGEVKIDSENPFFADKWFKYDAVTNPDSVFIEITKEQLGPLVVGLHYIKRNRTYYSTFLGKKKNVDDADVTLATGGLTFDRTTNEFRIGPKAKLTGKEYRGTTSSLDDKTNVITTVGKLNLPYNFTQKTIEMEVAGKWRDDSERKEITSNLVGSFNFTCIPKEAWSKLADKAKVVTAINNTIDWNDQAFREGLAEFMDPKLTQEDKNMQLFLSEVAKSLTYNDIKAHKIVPTTLFLSGIQFRFDREFKSLWYSGEVGLLGINADPINKVTSSNTKIEYAKGKITPAGVTLPDTLRMYLEFDEMNWVFYEFYGDVMYTISSDIDGYNAVLLAEKEKRKKNEGYRFEMSDDAAKDAYLSKFVNKYIWRTGRTSEGGEEDPEPNNGGTDGGGDNNGGINGGNNGGGTDGGTDGGKKEGGILDDGMDDGGKKEGSGLDGGRGGDLGDPKEDEKGGEKKEGGGLDDGMDDGGGGR